MTTGSAPVADEADAELLAALRAGDEDAFAALVVRNHGGMVRLAEQYVGSRAVAEEVAQDTWLAVIRGLDGFAGRSSLRTWIYAILLNRARTEGAKRARVEVVAFDDGRAAQALPPERFLGPGDRSGGEGRWRVPPTPWHADPEDRALQSEVRAITRDAIAHLPPQQRDVITLRDVQGWPPDEVCALLDLSEGNQRVLLHRARAKVRAALEHYFEQAAVAS